MIEGYPISARIEVRWRDIDALGHVNNAVYFTYLEIGRSRYWDQVFQARTIRDIHFIVASIQCDFLSQVSYGEPLEVGIRIPSVGRTSFDFEYEIRAVEDGRPVARARSAQVLYDYSRNEKTPLTEEWLEKVTAAQGKAPVRHEKGKSHRDGVKQASRHRSPG
jgi:acyl-CoA thioester hydrolase